MRKLFVRLLKRLTKSLDEEQEIICQPEKIKENQETQKEELQPEAEIISPIEIEEAEKKPAHKAKKKASCEIKSFDPRDIMEVMEVPFLALSKNRTAPIKYESQDGSIKVNISRHTNHYVASIYDWDIILFAASKMQEVINSGSDIPPRTLIVPRNELLKAIHKHDAHKQQKDLKASLNRLKSTLIETTIRNEDGKYDAGFGFLDSWGYTEREDIKEIKITLSQWLYDGICKKGSLLKVSQEYFTITSGLKKFLYRTARKHVGNQNATWEFAIETLYEKSGSEQELRKFKHDLKKIIKENNIPGYLLEWIERDGQSYVLFINARKEIKRMLSEPNDQPNLPFL